MTPGRSRRIDNHQPQLWLLGLALLPGQVSTQAGLAFEQGR
jgi:hypothetical protein